LAAQVRDIDVTPTVLELTGLPNTMKMNGESIVPIMRGTASADDRIAVSEYGRSAISVRWKGWKYFRDDVVFPKPPRDPSRITTATERLFHLAKDPRETTNLVQVERARAEEMRFVAADFFLNQRSGSYIVVAGGKGRRTFELTVGGTTTFAAESYLGAPVESDGSKGVKFAGSSENQLLVVAHVPVVPASGLTVDLRGDGAAHVVVNPSTFKSSPGELARAVSADKVGVFFFSGPPAFENTANDRQAVSAQQLESLKAMGYIK
jgi:hypothetical protein